MLIHRENALKAHQHNHLIYCSIQRDHFKKTILIQNLIKIFTRTHQIAHFFKNFSQLGSMPLAIACVQLISLFLYERTIFSFRMQSKYTLKCINYDMFSQKISGSYN